MNPSSYIDGRPLAGISVVEIWMSREMADSEGEAGGINPEEFEKKAGLFLAIPGDQLSSHQKITGVKDPGFMAVFLLGKDDLDGRRLVFALRIKDAKGKVSEYSDLLTVIPQAIPDPPARLRAEVFEDRIVIRWEAPDKNWDQSSPPRLEGYNVYRLEMEAEPRLINSSLLVETSFEDHEFVFGMVYRYIIRSSAAISAPFLESNDSDILEVAAKDVFAPSVPQGLTAVKSAGLITLIWNANKESDLAGYRVWRMEDEAEGFVLLTEQAVLENTYTDSAVEKNKRYEYAITAVDQSGNESRKSEPVRESLENVLI
jgi:hypothetical protein